MTIRQLNKQHPENYVMVSREFNEPVFVAPITGLSFTDMHVTPELSEAEKWSYADTISTVKLDYYRQVMGFNFQWEKA